ncbi:hypothetical protein MferCBS31731_007584 [Microsporum ferrugineum]
MASILELEADQPTVDLIIQLQLQDAGLYFESRKGKSQELTDEELAFQLQNEEFESMCQFLSDRRMATSFAAAVQADGRVLADNQLEEERAVKDRDIARHLTKDGYPVKAEDRQSNPESVALDDETLAKLRILFVSGSEGYDDANSMETPVDEIGQAESSTHAAKRTRQSQPILRCCIACREETEFVNVARVPCGHEYCRPCLGDLFKASMIDESLFPPRCCQQPIVLDIARIFLKSDLVHSYEKKKVEFETPNRTYCYSSRCLAFIPPSFIEDDVATCPDCGSTTCTTCKERAHTGDCPNDTPTQQLLATAQENGWQRCYSCWRVVELNHGCNHMTLVTLCFPSCNPLLTIEGEIAANVAPSFVTAVESAGKPALANNGMNIVSLSVQIRLSIEK